MNHAIRVSLPYADCSGIFRLWSDRCNTAMVVEHESDDEVKRTHCHLSLYGCLVKAEALKRMWKDAPGAGNAFWSFKPLEPWPVDNTIPTYIIYMLKGGHGAVKFLKNISPVLLSEAIERWETKSPDPKPAKPKKEKEDLYVIVDCIRDRYIKAFPPGTVSEYDDTTEFLDRRKITDRLCDIAIHVLKEKRKRYNIFDFARYITPIVAEDANTAESFKATIYGKIFSDKV